ncbi:MAG TPA: EamA family transporter [Acidimicrobiia bacterium]|nr:EamA family transporter [Acidimicrobiia bacterium]
MAEAVLAGGNSVAIRFSNRELDPLWGAGLRFALAAGLIVVVMAGLKLEVPRGRALKGAVLFGLFQFAGAFGLYYYALVDIHAGLGQTLLALVPLATLVLAVAQRQERLSRMAVIGTLIGLTGVVLISQDPLRGSIPLLSLLAVLGSVLCFAQALVLVRRFPPIHPVALNAVGMAVSAPVLIGAAAIAGEQFALPQRVETWVALGYVAAIGSVVVFLLHVYVVQSWSASRTSYVMVLIPFVTVVLSAWLDQEPVTTGLALGGLLVIAGVYVGALRQTRVPASGPSSTSRW